MQQQVENISKFERFFRASAGLDIDKMDIRRCNEFIEK